MSVADGTVVAPGAIGTASVSGDGRYVIFETVEGLAPQDGNGGLDVYVRDMDMPVTDGKAYELASALDGGDQSADYGNGGSRVGPAGFGLSDDGRTAVFFTSGTSNLPSGGAIATPARQVLVRRLDEHHTILMTRARADGAPVEQPANLASLNPVLSGDGGTVVWLDGNSAAQVGTLPGEPNAVGAFLWRRVDGSATRRVSGATDLEDPACDPATPFASGDTVTGPCYGPFVAGDASDVDGTGRVVAPPSISDDGLRVLFLSTAKRRPFDPATARQSGSLYLSDLRAGVPRKVAVGRVISMTGDKAISSAVLAGDGRHAILTANSAGFDGPRVIGTLPSSGSGATEVWAADLDAGTVQRATIAASGGDYHGAPVGLPDAGRLRRSGAGDARHRRRCACDRLRGARRQFVSRRRQRRGRRAGHPRRDRRARAPAGAITSLPAPGADADPVAAQSFGPLVAPRAVHPVIGYPVVGRDGIARLTVRVPAAGSVTGEATTKAGGRTARVARAARPAKGAGTITLKLRPSKAITKRLRSRAVKATISVRYRPKAGASTTAKRTVTFPRRRAAR